MIAPLMLIRAVLPAMKERHFGRIVHGNASTTAWGSGSFRQRRNGDSHALIGRNSERKQSKAPNMWADRFTFHFSETDQY
jgi:hypothetical protein